MAEINRSDDAGLAIYDEAINRGVAPSATLALDHALDHAKTWLDGLDRRPVSPEIDLASLRDRLGGAMPDRGILPERVIDELVALSESGHMGSASGRFFAWVIGGSLTSALAADWLVSTWDQNAAIYACGPSVSVVEQTAGAWILGLLDLPREASFAFTTGCQSAHVTGLAAAQHSLLMRQGWNVEEESLFTAQRLTVLTTAQHHESIERAVRFLGIGRKSIELIPMNENGQATATGLSAALQDTDGPTIVVLNAADLNIGACDDFSELIPIAHAANAWVHIDGAFGLFARASRSKRHLVDGVDLADSWATEAENNARTAEVIDRINATGEAFFSGVDWKGKRAMRVSVINWRTTLADVERSIEAVSTALDNRRNFR